VKSYKLIIVVFSISKGMSTTVRDCAARNFEPQEKDGDQCRQIDNTDFGIQGKSCFCQQDLCNKSDFDSKADKSTIFLLMCVICYGIYIFGKYL